MEHDPFKEYIRQAEPNKRERGYAWHTAIGLQAVDGLKPSQYLIDTAIKNIEGDISMDETNVLHNRSMHISGVFLQSAAEEVQSAKIDKPKCKNCTLEEQSKPERFKCKRKA